MWTEAKSITLGEAVRFTNKGLLHESKSEGVDYFRHFWCDTRADGVLSTVVQNVRSDSGGELNVIGPVDALRR